MHFLALLQKLVADVTPANIELYITLLDNIIVAAEKISESQNPVQDGPAKS